MKKINGWIIAIAAAFLLLFLPMILSKKSTEKISVGGKELQVEIMRTESEKEKGLSDRKNLCSNCGLLFIYDSEGIYPYWMRRMYFDIDILWLNKDRVVDITYGAKAPVAAEFDAPKTIYQSKVPSDKVLEVNAGWAEKNGIKVGDVVK